MSPASLRQLFEQLHAQLAGLFTRQATDARTALLMVPDLLDLAQLAPVHLRARYLTQAQQRLRFASSLLH